MTPDGNQATLKKRVWRSDVNDRTQPKVSAAQGPGKGHKGLKLRHHEGSQS